MGPAKSCVVLAALCVVAACAGIDSNRPSSGSTPRGVLPDDTVSPTEHRGLPRPRLPARCSVWLPHRSREPGQARRAPYPHLRDARTRCLGDAQARSGRVPVGRARRGRVVRGGVHGQARTQRRPRGHLRRPARHAPRRPPPRMSRMGAVPVRRGQPSLRGGIDHRRRRRGDQGVPRPVGRRRRRPRCLQQHGERRRHRRPQGGAGHRHLERLRGLLRIEARVDRPARSPAGHPQRGPRFGVAPHEQHRRDVVVGSGQFVQGDLRRVCCPARLRRRLPEPGSGLHGHGESPRPDARRRAGQGRSPAHR